LAILAAMMFMVIEYFKRGDVERIGERFRAKGRMLPDGVTYHASWIDSATPRCFQLMEAPDAKQLRLWTESWNDLVQFEIVPVVTSAEFWSSQSPL
jgi:uncharacterized protein DUF3303